MSADCLNRNDYDHAHTQDRSEHNPYPSQNFAADEVDYEDAAGEHPFSALRKLLSAGYFYYSVDFDMTSRLQDRSVVVLYAFRVELRISDHMKTSHSTSTVWTKVSCGIHI